jgi:hypothetical protein
MARPGNEGFQQLMPSTAAYDAQQGWEEDEQTFCELQDGAKISFGPVCSETMYLGAKLTVKTDGPLLSL